MNQIGIAVVIAIMPDLMAISYIIENYNSNNWRSLKVNNGSV